MALNFPKWLKDEMGMTDEEVTLHQGTLGAIFTPERQAKLEQGYLNATQLTAAQQAHAAKVQQDQEALAEAQRQHDNSILAWAETENKTKAQREADAAEYARTQARLAAMAAVVRQTAAQAGLDPEATVNAALQAAGQPAGVVPPVTPPAGTTTMPDMSNYLTRDVAGRLTNISLMAPAILNQLQREYHALTGESFDDVKVVQEVLKRANDPRNQKSVELRDVYMEMFDVQAKQTAAEQKRVDTLVAEAEARGRQAGLSEAAIPGSGQMHNAMPVGHHSPVLAAAGSRTPVMQRPGAQSQQHSDAVLAFQSGKYRQERPGAPAARTA